MNLPMNSCKFNLFFYYFVPVFYKYLQMVSLKWKAELETLCFPFQCCSNSCCANQGSGCVLHQWNGRWVKTRKGLCQLLEPWYKVWQQFLTLRVCLYFFVFLPWFKKSWNLTRWLTLWRGWNLSFFSHRCLAWMCQLMNKVFNYEIE